MDKEGLVSRKPLRIEPWRVFVEPNRLVGRPVNPHHHRGGDVRRLVNISTPRRENLIVTGEHNRLGPARWDVHRHLTPTVVVERLGEKLARHGVDGRTVSHNSTANL